MFEPDINALIEQSIKNASKNEARRKSRQNRLNSQSNRILTPLSGSIAEWRKNKPSGSKASKSARVYKTTLKTHRVKPFEDTREVRIDIDMRPGDNVRPAGELICGMRLSLKKAPIENYPIGTISFKAKPRPKASNFGI